MEEGSEGWGIGGGWGGGGQRAGQETTLICHPLQHVHCMTINMLSIAHDHCSGLHKILQSHQHLDFLLGLMEIKKQTLVPTLKSWYAVSKATTWR